MKGAKYFDGKTYHVRFGRKIHRRFKSEAEADRFLTGIHYLKKATDMCPKSADSFAVFLVTNRNAEVVGATG